MDLLIRRAKSSDFPALAQLISTTDAWQRYNIDYEAALKIFINMVEDEIFVGELDNQIVGFITLRLNGVGNFGAYIRMVAVAHKFRGQGIGARLVDYISKVAFQHIPNLFLICSVDNEAAQKFYQRMGFKQAGILSDLVLEGHDEIFFRKTAGPLKNQKFLKT